MDDAPIDMIIECTNCYEAIDYPNGYLEIRIGVPERFATLWTTKLEELRTTMSEIEEFEKYPRSSDDC